MNLVYGCILTMCLFGGLFRVFILSRNVMIQTKLGFLFNWCSHAFISRLFVVISANNILDLGCSLIWSISYARCGKFLIALSWLR